MYGELLMQIADDFGMGLDDLCFMVVAGDFEFPFSFFAFEDDDILGILVTDENGAEKLHIVVKSEIVYLKVHYLDELETIFDFEDDNKHKVVNMYV